MRSNTPPEGGHIELGIAEGPVITVADSGPGIASDQHDKVLERFVRLDKTRHSPGNGLGLSLVNAVAKLHGAALVLEDNKPGLRVVLDFGGQRAVDTDAKMADARRTGTAIGTTAMPVATSKKA